MTAQATAAAVSGIRRTTSREVSDTRGRRRHMQASLQYRIDLPRWDQQKSVRITPSGRPKPIRIIWDPLQGNSRSHWRQRHHATTQVIEAVAWSAKHLHIPQAQHLTVTLTWAPGDNRRRDADNLWPLLKVCCDALARGPRTDLPGLRLVPDDTPEWMAKNAPVIASPPADGLWLDVVAIVEDAGR